MLSRRIKFKINFSRTYTKIVIKLTLLGGGGGAFMIELYSKAFMILRWLHSKVSPEQFTICPTFKVFQKNIHTLSYNKLC